MVEISVSGANERFNPFVEFRETTPVSQQLQPPAVYVPCTPSPSGSQYSTLMGSKEIEQAA